MSDVTRNTNEGGSPNPWKWTTIGLGGLVAVVLLVGIVKAGLDKGDTATPAGETATIAAGEDVAGDASGAAPAAETRTPAKTAAPKPAPVRVAAAPPAAPVAAAPPQPTQHDIAVCNSYAEQARTQTADVVKKGVIGGALGAGVGAATGAIADGGKGAGKGAGIGAIVGATAGTVYGLNQKSQDNTRAEQAYRQCMAQRGF